MDYQTKSESTELSDSSACDQCLSHDKVVGSLFVVLNEKAGKKKQPAHPAVKHLISVVYKCIRFRRLCTGNLDKMTSLAQQRANISLSHHNQVL